MFRELVEKKKKLAVVGLGYVGLPIALEFARKVSVIGFDIKPDRIELMKKKIDPSNELPSETFDDCDILFTSSIQVLAEASFYIIAVPTPINQHKLPDLQPLIMATETVSKCIKPGDYVVYESTVYPGCTEEDCIPILERGSGLKAGKDFKVGYSPERINPGDTRHTLTKILKVTSGIDEESAGVITEVYKLIITAGVYKAGSIKVAEAAKIIENTQRDINIAFMNELSMIFNLMDINTYEVLEAAGTKWNFLPFVPGLVGGHCIGVDPYYLSYKAKEYGHHALIINSGRAINDGMGSYIVRQIIKKLISSGKDLRKNHVLIMGITFKENVSDIRNSKVMDIYREFVSFGFSVDITDPYADAHEVKMEYGLDLVDNPAKKYDIIVLAVNHKEYLEYPENYYLNLGKADFLFVDIKGVFRMKHEFKNYWSL